MNSRWSRSLWMRLGAAQACCAAMIFMLGHPTENLLLASQIQFMHGMATIACCTFMGVGGLGARKAPKFFQTGIGVFCLPAWSAALGHVWPYANAVQLGGTIILLTGWLTMIHGGRTIDRAHQP
jgi:uncharacterized membrane protein YgdD (TMEM256/DUF423 family)